MAAMNFHLVSIMLSIGLGSYLFARSIAKDMTETLNTIEKSPKNEQTSIHGVAELLDFIQIHSTVKQLSKIVNCENVCQSQYIEFS